MSKYIKKIRDRVNNISPFSGRIIIHGLQFSIALITLAFIFNYINHFSYRTSFITVEMAKISLFLFAESIICGLLIDYYIKKDSSK